MLSVSISFKFKLYIHFVSKCTFLFLSKYTYNNVHIHVHVCVYTIHCIVGTTHRSRRITNLDITTVEHGSHEGQDLSHQQVMVLRQMWQHFENGIMILQNRLDIFYLLQTPETPMRQRTQLPYINIYNHFTSSECEK